MINKLIKFVMGGISNTIFSYLIYCLCVIFFNYKVSYFICILVSIIYTYQINTKLVFGIKSNLRIRSLYFLIYLIQIILGLSLIDIWVNKLLITKYLAPILNIIFVSPIVFLLSYYISRKSKI